jgi:recombination protein RecA
MSQALRKLTSIVNRSQTCLIFINQIREKIGATSYGVTETTPGGRALKFYASLRIDIRKVASIKQGEENIGARTRIRIVKNKLSPPFKQADVDLMFGEGFSREGDLIDLGLEHKLIARSGAWFSFGDVKLGQGREAAQLREKLGLAAPNSAGTG